MKIAILQSNYLPWKGVFDIINSVDEFVFYEDVQYTKNDWRNRNKIKTANGTAWLSVPIVHSGKSDQKIYEAKILSSSKWQRKHYNALIINYAKAPFFKQYKWLLDELYLENEWTNLSELNIFSTKLISEILGIKTKFHNSLDLKATGSKTTVLINICKELKADCYLSGPAAKDYIDDQDFINAGIDLQYMKYEYPEYPQLYGNFEHGVSVLDLLFNVGEEASHYIWLEEK